MIIDHPATVSLVRLNDAALVTCCFTHVATPTAHHLLLQLSDAVLTAAVALLE